MDLEMSGLHPEKDVILEIATIVTDANLNILAEGPVIAIHQPENVFESMDEWNTRHHNQSGLVDRCRRSQYSLKDAEQETLRFIKPFTEKTKNLLCGNSITQDRRFLYKYMQHQRKHDQYGEEREQDDFRTSTCPKFRNGSATGIST